MNETIQFLGISKINNSIQPNNVLLPSKRENELISRTESLNKIFFDTEIKLAEMNQKINHNKKSNLENLELDSGKIFDKSISNEEFSLFSTYFNTEKNDDLDSKNNDLLSLKKDIIELNSSNNITNQYLQTSIEKCFQENDDDIKVKDKFILNQINLINKYYQIDNLSSKDLNNKNMSEKNSFNIISETALVNASSSPTSTPLSSLCTSVKDSEKFDFDNLSKTNKERAYGLRNFIEKLLNRSPSSSDFEINNQKHISVDEVDLKTFDDSYIEFSPCYVDEKLNIKYMKTRENKQNLNHEIDVNNNQNKFDKHDISDLELGYHKRYPTEYYDDVKCVLKFDEDDNCEKLEMSNSNSVTNINPSSNKKISKSNKMQKCHQIKSLNPSLSISLNSINPNESHNFYSKSFINNPVNKENNKKNKFKTNSASSLISENIKNIKFNKTKSNGKVVFKK